MCALIDINSSAITPIQHDSARECTYLSIDCCIKLIIICHKQVVAHVQHISCLIIPCYSPNIIIMCRYFKNNRTGYKHRKTTINFCIRMYLLALIFRNNDYSIFRLQNIIQCTKVLNSNHRNRNKSKTRGNIYLRRDQGLDFI